MYIIKKSGPVLLNMAVFVANIIIAAKSDFICVPTDWIRLVNCVHVAVFVTLGYHILNANRIYFDRQNIYIESIYDLNEISIVPVKDIVCFEMTMLRSMGAYYYRLTYICQGETIQKLFVPYNKNIGLFQQLLGERILTEVNSSIDSLA